ncbi:DUF1120 domain-containing protein [Cupriavidus agavae]|uniref:Uncharacterized protein DUF1120 n=1 Tax=Cupriavidus agavae TaxID=1001822 RepID=A0A4V2FI61_9BURK|nr:DUF1120 domain-containing protein [Cupriavidus agavae]RZT42659.1 uncharacterized protein DUF1120 [Cupriavidus agavae]
MNTAQRMLAGVVLGLCAMGAQAAENADLSVGGLIRPAACNVSLSNNGVVDQGIVKALDLKNSEFTRLDDATLTMNIDCEASMAVAVGLTDARSGSSVSGIPHFITSAYYDGNGFGLGKSGNNKLGSYVIVPKHTATADGKTVTTIWKGASTGWKAYSSNDAMGPAWMHSWSGTSGTSPVNHQNISQELVIKTALNKKADLPNIDSDLPIDGLATFTLRYL